MARELHRTLRRQLRRAQLEERRCGPDADGWDELLRRVSQAYADAEEDRYTLERSLETCSREMQQLNAELREERDKLHSLTSDGVCHLDPCGKVLSLNPEAERITGLCQAHAAGGDLLRQLTILVAATDPQPLDIERLLACLAAGELQRVENAIVVRSDGSRIAASLAFNPIVSGGEVRGSMLILRDCTAQREAESVRAARDAAESASEAKSRFLATMSHEIRTPMHGLLGTLALLEDSSLDREQYDCVRTSMQSAERLLAIIDDILDFSKIEAGQVRIETIDFDLRPEVESAISLYTEIKAADVELACFIAEDVPIAVSGDPTRLRQVLTNLVGNAVKFTREGEILLRVTLAQQLEEHAVVRFEMCDTGIGISDDARGKIFDAFSQADDTTTRLYGGTGLGLSICRELTELMGGELRALDGPGGGSIFAFELKLALGHPSTCAPAALPGLRALVVEDADTTRKILDAYLTQWGATTRAAAGADAALLFLEREAFDVVLIDATLGEASGVELAACIRADGRFAALPILLLSSSNADRDAARWAGFETVLCKPLRQGALHEALCRTQGIELASKASDTPRDELALSGQVLIVDDNPVNRRVALAMLSKLGLSAELACDGIEALEALTRGSYDAVLMDCQMPRMDGLEAARAIRALEAGLGKRTSIIAMTANATSEDRLACLDAGMDDFLSKPATTAAIAEVLARWLRPAPALDSAHRFTA